MAHSMVTHMNKSVWHVWWGRHAWHSGMAQGMGWVLGWYVYGNGNWEQLCVGSMVQN